MRLLTNDEMIAVSGGSITGYDDPHCLSAKADYSPAAMTAACPGGWRIKPGTTRITRNGFERRGREIECDTGNDSRDDSNDDSNDSDNSDSDNDSGSDTGSNGDD